MSHVNVARMSTTTISSVSARGQKSTLTYGGHIWALLINHNHINVRKTEGTDGWTDRFCCFMLSTIDAASIIISSNKPVTDLIIKKVRVRCMFCQLNLQFIYFQGQCGFCCLKLPICFTQSLIARCSDIWKTTNVSLIWRLALCHRS